MAFPPILGMRLSTYIINITPRWSLSALYRRPTSLMIIKRSKTALWLIVRCCVAPIDSRADQSYSCSFYLTSSFDDLVVVVAILCRSIKSSFESEHSDLMESYIYTWRWWCSLFVATTFNKFWLSCTSRTSLHYCLPVSHFYAWLNEKGSCDYGQKVVLTGEIGKAWTGTSISTATFTWTGICFQSWYCYIILSLQRGRWQGLLLWVSHHSIHSYASFRYWICFRLSECRIDRGHILLSSFSWRRELSDVSGLIIGLACFSPTQQTSASKPVCSRAPTPLLRLIVVSDLRFSVALPDWGSFRFSFAALVRYQSLRADFSLNSLNFFVQVWNSLPELQNSRLY